MSSLVGAGPETHLSAENQEDTVEGHVQCMLFPPEDLAFLTLL